MSFFVISIGSTVFAQQAIIEFDGDDTLPIAQTRYDDAVEPPKENFSSVSKQDNWEKFERGELNEKAFVRLQEEYQMAASASKDPYVKRKIASDIREKKREDAQKRKEEKAAKRLEEKQKKKREEATKFDREVDLMAKEKEIAFKKAQKEKTEKVSIKTKRLPASKKRIINKNGKKKK